MRTAESYLDGWYEASIKSREDEFAKQFGPSDPPRQVFKSKDEQWEMTIPGFGFLRYPPTPERPYWLYLTHGLSQPAKFEDFKQGYEGGLSGYGLEFALASRDEEAWPFHMLELISRYMLSSGNHIHAGDRFPASDLMEEGSGGGLLAMTEPGHATQIPLLSGVARIKHLLGVTAAELEKAREYPARRGSEILEKILRHYGIGCVTDRGRKCTTTHPDFATNWAAAEGEMSS